MKIFSWVHQKFHPKDDKKTEPMNCYHEMEKQVLLKQVALDDVLGSLGDGILTIGTFGFDPMAKFDVSTEIEVDDYQKYEAEKEPEEANNHSGSNECGEEKEELKPLVFAVFGGDLNEKVESCIEMGTLESIENDIVLDSDVGIVLGDDKLKNKKEGRVTLKDLFSAEYEEEVKTKHDSSKLKKIFKRKANDNIVVKKKSANSLGKKLNPGAGGDSDKHPIKKVQRLMRKMIKKKIHPSMEDKIIPNTTTDESDFLLPEEEAAVCG